VKVVILWGGPGTRPREETEFRPKPMVEYVLDSIQANPRAARTAS